MPIARIRLGLLSTVLSIVILATGGVLNVVFSMMKARPTKESRATPSTAVTTLTAQSQTYCERLVGYAKARPVTLSEIAAGVAGEIVWISAELKAGNFVAAGTELVRIDDADLQSAVSSAEARLAQAEVGLHQNEISVSKLNKLVAITRQELLTTQRMHERLKRLSADNGVSESEFDNSLLQVAQQERAALELEERWEFAGPEVKRAQAEVTAAEATLAQARSDLKRAVIRAPYSGFIDERMAQLGSRVSVGAALLRMVDNSEIEVPVVLPANVYYKVVKGSSASIRLTEDGPVVWRGYVSTVSPMINDEDRTFFAYLTIHGSIEQPVVPAGAFVIAEIEATRHSNVFVVPRTALVGDHLFIVTKTDGETSVVQQRTPKIRKLLTAVALLDDGVKPGEAVVVSNVEKITDGSRVIVTETKNALAHSGADQRAREYLGGSHSDTSPTDSAADGSAD